MHRFFTRQGKGSLTLAIGTVLLLSSGAPVSAQIDTKTLDELKASSGVKPFRIWNSSDETIIEAELSNQASDEILRKQAEDWAKVLLKSGANGGKIARMNFLFIDRTGTRYKSISLQSDVLANLNKEGATPLKDLPVVDGQRIAFAEPVEPRMSVTVLPMPEKKLIRKSDPAEANHIDYLKERPVVVERINRLQAAGVGTKPYMDELIKLDDLYRKGETGAIKTGMMNLLQLIANNEMLIQRAKQTAAAKPQAIPTAAIAASSALTSSSSISDVSGTTGQVMQSLIAAHVKDVLGSEAPGRGSFALERYRVAMRIKELQGQGKDVQSYRSMYHRIEDLVAQHNSSVLPQVVTDLKYLQHQLGLPELQAGQ